MATKEFINVINYFLVIFVPEEIEIAFLPYKIFPDFFNLTKFKKTQTLGKKAKFPTDQGF